MRWLRHAWIRPGRARAGVVWMAGVAWAAAGCGRSTTPAEEVQSCMSATSMPEPLDSALGALGSSPGDRKKLVAVVRCDRVTYAQKGTRSERIQFHVRVVGRANGASADAIVVTHGYDKTCLMTPGKTYFLIAADEPQWPDWNLEYVAEVAPADAEAVLAKARAKLSNAP